jgi:signal transduction histidine kinase
MLTGALLWSAGLFVGAGIIVTAIFRRYPHVAVGFHQPFTYVTASTAVVVACLAAGLVQLRRPLSVLGRLRAGLSQVHAGRAPRVPGEFPNELQPLVDDLNALLDHREQMVRRAVSRAGDLAHGLKTPLAVLAREAECLARQRDPGRADVLRQQVDRMRRQIDYHLAHARAAASGAMPGASCDVATSAEGLVRTLARLHAERGLSLRAAVPAGIAVRAQREDLDELLGNLLDNACTWARSAVEVSARAAGGVVEITVDDDGPGVAAEMRTAVLRRGVRADEAAPGSGFGLAIVADLAELYGGSISLDTSEQGGVRARLILPSASVAA